MASATARRPPVRTALLAVLTPALALVVPLQPASADDVPAPVVRVGSRAQDGTLSALLGTSPSSNLHLFRPEGQGPLPLDVPVTPGTQVRQSDDGVDVRFADGTAHHWQPWGASWNSYPMAAGDVLGAGDQVSGAQQYSVNSARLVRGWPGGVFNEDLYLPPGYGTGVVELRASSRSTVIARTNLGRVLLGAGSVDGQVMGPRSLPPAVETGGAVSVDSRRNVDAAVTPDGKVWVFAGDGAPVTPAVVPPTLCRAKVIRLPGTVVCRDNGTVQVFAAWEGYDVVQPPAGLAGVVDVAAGPGYWLARTAAGTVVAWGPGAGIVPTGLTGVTDISAGVLGSVVTSGSLRAVTVWRRSDGTDQVRWTPPADVTPTGYEAQLTPGGPWTTLAKTARTWPLAAGQSGDGVAVRARYLSPEGRNQAGPATTATRIDRPVKYVALGDSFSSGEGNPPYVSASACHRSRDAYAWKLHDRLGGAAFVDLAFWPCSGALSRDVLFPNVHHPEEHAQRSWLSSDTDVVTLTLGGNDVGFPDYVQGCLSFSSAASLISLAGASWNRPLTEAERHEIEDMVNGDCQKVDQASVVQPGDEEAHLVYVLERIRALAPKARLVVLGYPQLVSDPAAWSSDDLTVPITWHGLTVDGAHLSRDDAHYLYDILGPALNRHARAAARAVGASFVDEYDAFAGHELGTPDPWVTPIRADIQQESIHPTARGQKAMADRITGSVVDGGEPPSTMPTVEEPLTLRMLTSEDHVQSDFPDPNVTVQLGKPLYSCIDSYVGAEPVPVQLQRLGRTGWKNVKTADPVVVSGTGHHWSMTSASPWSLSLVDPKSTTAMLLTARACWPVNTTFPFSGTYRWTRPKQGRLAEVSTQAFGVSVSA